MLTYLYKILATRCLRVVAAGGVVLLLSGYSRAQTSSEGFADPQLPKNGSARESKWFVRAYGSYGLPLGGSYRPGNAVSSAGSAANQIDYKLNKKGLGQGWRVGGGIGYILNEVINLGLDVEQYWSGDVSAFSTYRISETYESGDRYYYSTFTNTTFSARMLTVTPNITFKAISKPNFYIYNRLGVSIGVKNTLTSQDSVAVDYYYYSSSRERNFYTNGRQLNVKESEYKYEGGIPIGFIASLGLQARITNNIRLFAELQATSLNYSPKKRILTSQFENGNDRLLEDNLIPRREKEVQYVNSLSIKTSGAEANANQPEQQIKLRFPYSSIGLSAGLAYRF